LGDKLEKNDGPGMQRVGGTGEAYTGFWWQSLKERDHLEDPSINRRIILRWIFREAGVWAGLSWLRIEQVAGICECSNEPSGSIKCGEFLD
jgi:hypothetical protein